MMILQRLIDVLPRTAVVGDTSVQVHSVVCDSRAVTPGALFVAIRGGQEQDRHAYVADAVARGACGIVVEDPTDPLDCAVIQVGDTRRALAALAARIHGWPDRALRLVGVTGTNGKTTTALLLQQVLRASGSACAYLGTLGAHTPHGVRELPNTTPEAPELYAQLRSMTAAGVDSVVLEASSHGLALQRLEGLQFAGAVFTNLTRDHLDFHGTEARYLDAKIRLFESLKPGSVAVVNADDPAAAAFRERCPVPVLGYGRSPGADYRLTRVICQARGGRVELATPSGTLVLDTSLCGVFNAYNVAAAASCGLALGVPGDVVAQGIAALERVPGRFESIRSGQEFRVIVDYAHTPDGLENVLRAAREITAGRVLCLFGCGGDRDPGKRPQMAATVERLADAVYVTSDNPRSEEPAAIIADILAGMECPAAVHVDPDRRAAIAAVLGQAHAGDTVVLAGKGHETGQIVGDRILPFSDADVVRELLCPPGLVDAGGAPCKV